MPIMKILISEFALDKLYGRSEDYLKEDKYASGSHMLTSTNRLETDKGNLHGENEPEDVEAGIGNIEA